MHPSRFGRSVLHAMPWWGEGTPAMAGRGDCAEYSISGLVCDGCKAVVEEAIRKVEGVESIEVDVASGRAIVCGTASMEALAVAVRSTGRSLGPSEVVVLTVRVSGMVCGHCSAQVEDAVLKVDGVESATVDLEKGLVTVRGTAPSSFVLRAIEATGKTAAIEEAPDAETASAGSAAVVSTVPPVSTVTGGSESTDEAVPGATGSTAAMGRARAVTLKVTGMVCEGCRATIKRVLHSNPKVNFVAINLHTGVVSARGDAGAAELISAIQMAGRFAAQEFPAVDDSTTAFSAAPSAQLADADIAPQPQVRTASLLVVDMVCNGCKAKVTRALHMVQGVRAVSIELEEHTARVSFASVGVDETLNAMLVAVAAAGYEASLHQEVEEETERETERETQDAPLIFSLRDDKRGAGGDGGSGVRASKGGKGDAGSKGGKGEERHGHVQEVCLSIDGMSCAACVGAVEGALRGMDGVLSASVSLMGKSGKVSYDERRIDVPAIVKRVCDTGFAAEVQAEDEDMLAAVSSFGQEAARWKRLFLGSLLFTAPVFLISMVSETTRPSGATRHIPVTSISVLVTSSLR